MSVQTLHRFTVNEYHRMVEVGLLKPDAQVELLDGRIVDMMPIGPFHGGTVNRLNRLFTQLSRGRWLVTIQNPVHLDDHSEPQPDVMLLKPSADDYTSSHPGPEDVHLLIEIADSTLTYDRGEKLPAYGRAGIPEVWIINLPEQIIEVYREPHYTGYGSTTRLRSEDEARPLAFPDVAVAVKTLLSRAK